ncbi:tRNA (adenosine(37)-N6)-dimethylallyltransferase MiaA [Patescibacteria group bacterium]
MNKVNIILGPTSSGKTSLVVDLCKKLNGEIISADSRQIYKHMDVGTGKKPIKTDIDIKKGENHWILNGIKVWGYDLVDPNTYYSAYDYAVFAINKIKEIIESGKNPFLVGGTGFYINIVTGDVMTDQTPPDFKLREVLENYSKEQLKEELEKINPELALKTDLMNPVRMIRAIEKTKSTIKREPLELLKDVEFTKIGLIASRSYLYERVDSWVEDIWKKGLLEETKWLMESEFSNSDKLKGLVYKTAVGYLKKEVEEKEAIEKTKHDLHAYIRRQQTYFKKMKDISWIDIEQDNKFETVYNIANG